jgi:hypothetical protein
MGCRELRDARAATRILGRLLLWIASWPSYNERPCLAPLLVVGGVVMTRAPDPAEVRALREALDWKTLRTLACDYCSNGSGFQRIHEDSWRQFAKVLASATEAPPVAGMGEGIPSGMKPWYGDDSAPGDWDGSDQFLFRNGRGYQSDDDGWFPYLTEKEQWSHDGDEHDIVAYTPLHFTLTKPTPPASVSGEVVVPRSVLEWATHILLETGEEGQLLAEIRQLLAAAPEAAAPSALHQPKLGEGDYAYLKREHLPMALREQAKDALFCEAEPHAVIDAWNIIQIAADELEAPSAVGGVDRMREALGFDPLDFVAEGRLHALDMPRCIQRDYLNAALDRIECAALTTGETSPVRGEG